MSEQSEANSFEINLSPSSRCLAMGADPCCCLASTAVIPAEKFLRFKTSRSGIDTSGSQDRDSQSRPAKGLFL